MKIILLVTCFVLSLTTSVYAGSKSAAEKQADLIKYRQSGMMYLRWNMGKIKSQVIKNPETFNRANIISAAKVIAAIADSNMSKLYPETTKSGTGWKKTRVKQAYFDEKDKVKENYMKLIEEADKLEELSGFADAGVIRAQFKKVLSSCKSCHKGYRSKI